METIQQMTYDFDDRHTLDDLKEQLQEDVLTWTAGLEASLTNPCNYTVSDMGPVWNRDDNDVTRLCQIIVERVNEFALAKGME
jgi:23S rRNA U2552 (ribose-2'-O)-methylase RlmE/FtsJ